MTVILMAFGPMPYACTPRCGYSLATAFLGEFGSMVHVIGLILVLVLVFTGYTLAGGKFGVILAALPFEMMMIGGAALGAFLCANSVPVIKQCLGDLKKVMSGAKWNAEDYKDLLCLLFTISKVMKTKGMMALEPHIENPEESKIFQQYPKILHDHFAIDFITDTVRMMSMNLDDPHQVEDAMDKTLEKHHHESSAPADALQTMSDGLPALGIVAAVLGIIKTMSSINEPPEVLGKLIGGALTGTFLGVFLSYGFVGPVASRLRACYHEEHQFYIIIKDMMVAHLHGNAAQVSVELGRAQVPTYIQPTFEELEEALGAIPAEATA